MASSQKRRSKDVMKLMMSDYTVRLAEEDGSDFYVDFHGPKETLYEGGEWVVHVTLPDQYPYSSPSIGFATPIFHPNVDVHSGTVCLDVLNQQWSPMYSLNNVFDVFLPQLLHYPNPKDPLNAQAAELLLRDNKKYAETVIQFIDKYARNTFSGGKREKEEGRKEVEVRKAEISNAAESGSGVSVSLNNGIFSESKTGRESDEQESVGGEWESNSLKMSLSVDMDLDSDLQFDLEV